MIFPFDQGRGIWSLCWCWGSQSICCVNLWEETASRVNFSISLKIAGIVGMHRAPSLQRGWVATRLCCLNDGIPRGSGQRREANNFACTKHLQPFSNKDNNKVTSARLNDIWSNHLQAWQKQKARIIRHFSSGIDTFKTAIILPQLPSLQPESQLSLAECNFTLFNHPPWILQRRYWQCILSSQHISSSCPLSWWQTLDQLRFGIQ